MKSEMFLNSQIALMCGVREVVGQKLGIELELEGRGVALPDVATRGWNRHNEPSLRGESIEYATAGGKKIDEAKKLVTDLFEKFKKGNVRFNNSLRTSTHVHLNFSDCTVKQAVNFFSLFTVIEEVLQYYSGEDRKGNQFCLSTREAEGIVGVLSDAIGKGDLNRFSGDRYKYAACNLSALFKFGTVEVRTMKGASSAEEVNAWLDILNDMYVYALEKMNGPIDLVKDLSFAGAEALMKKVFKPENLKELMLCFPAVNNLHQSLMEGARVIQVFSYEFEEAFNAKVEIKKMPKGAAALPVQIKEGRWAGQPYAIYKPDGRRWNLAKGHRDGNPLIWQDGDRVSDDKNIQWLGAHQRFVVVYPDGEVVPCRWYRHHEIQDEGEPIHHRRMPRAVVDERFEEDEEPEVEEFFDDDEEGEEF